MAPKSPAATFGENVGAVSPPPAMAMPLPVALLPEAPPTTLGVLADGTRRQPTTLALRSASAWLSVVPRKLVAALVPALPLGLHAVAQPTVPSWATDCMKEVPAHVPATRVCTAAGSTASVPLPVMVPPVRPVPAATEVTGLTGGTIT